jgi:ACT domain-containing protein
MPDASESNQSFALQLIYPDQTGMFARIAQTIGQHGGDLGHIDLLGPSARLTTRGISIRVRDEQHLEEIVAAVRSLDKVKVVDMSDPSLPRRAGAVPARFQQRLRRKFEQRAQTRRLRRR